jgi:GrpB-like predicted nucleotidyltransferase (UPF0157 family)
MDNHQPPAISPFDRINIVSYKEAWPHEYRMIIQLLRPAFPKSVIFHHIGSTAVMGLAAKDIIDIQATVTSLGEIETDYLSRHGFHERTALSDHPPAGREVHPDQLIKRFFRGTIRPANLHVRLDGRFNQRYPLLCRDYLRAHPVSTASYQLIKERLASWFPDDADRYYDVKDALFDVMMDGAEAWARLVDWRVPEGDPATTGGANDSPDTYFPLREADKGADRPGSEGQ